MAGGNASSRKMLLLALEKGWECQIRVGVVIVGIQGMKTTLAVKPIEDICRWY
jgi:hypothetical protein